jgi:hypothetical protein
MFKDTRYRDDKKPKKSQKYHHNINNTGINRKVGNALSPSYSRPGLHNSRRIFDKAQIQDQIRHDTVDFLPEGSMYRKTACPKFIPFRKKKRNNQNHSYKLKQKKKSIPMIVGLPMIYEHLYISNLDYVLSNDIRDTGINYIINLSNHIISSDIEQVFISFSDDHNISHKHFSFVIDKVVRHIQYAVDNHKHILVHCNAGVNRSVSAIIAYALVTHQESVDRWVQYIESRKCNAGYPYWDTLTNIRMSNLLQCLFN